MSIYIFMQPRMAPFPGELYLMLPGAFNSFNYISGKGSVLASYRGPSSATVTMSVDDALLSRELAQFPGPGPQAEMMGGGSSGPGFSIGGSPGPMSARAAGKYGGTSSSIITSRGLGQQLILYGELRQSTSAPSYGDDSSSPDYVWYSCWPTKAQGSGPSNFAARAYTANGAARQYTAYIAGQGNYGDAVDSGWGFFTGSWG